MSLAIFACFWGILLDFDQNQQKMTKNLQRGLYFFLFSWLGQVRIGLTKTLASQTLAQFWAKMVRFQGR